MIYSASPFSRFAKWTARATGHPAAFMSAALIILVWGVTGPIFKFSDTWQLVINRHNDRHIPVDARAHRYTRMIRLQKSSGDWDLRIISKGPSHDSTHSRSG